MAIARSSSSGILMCYILPVLWSVTCLYATVTQWGVAGLVVVAYTHTDPPRGSTELAAKSAIYVCTVASAISADIAATNMPFNSLFSSSVQYSYVILPVTDD